MVFSASLLIELLISFFPAPHPSTAGARAWIHGPDMCGEYDLSGVWGFKCLEEKKKKSVCQVSGCHFLSHHSQ